MESRHYRGTVITRVEDGSTQGHRFMLDPPLGYRQVAERFMRGATSRPIGSLYLTFSNASEELSFLRRLVEEIPNTGIGSSILASRGEDWQYVLTSSRYFTLDDVLNAERANAVHRWGPDVLELVDRGLAQLGLRSPL